MEIYHGTIYSFEEPILNPTTNKSGKRSDFGKGFYATTSLRQAKDWAKKKMSKAGVNIGYVNIYEIDISTNKNLNIKTFQNIDEWIDFVEANRTIKGFTHNYDIVYGKVADDDIYQSFALCQLPIS